MNLPMPFGWKTSWIALRTTKSEALAEELRLTKLRGCDWEEGLREASDQKIYICPPVSGWTLIVGLLLPDASSEDTLPLIVRLSEIYQSVQYFANHRVVDYYAWARAERGRLVRAYAFLGEQGAVLWDRGNPTLEERELGLMLDDPLVVPYLNPHESMVDRLKRARSRKPPQEHHVFAIARKWSIDPTQIEDYEISQSLGMLGVLT